MISIFVNLAGIVLIILIIWWFLILKPKSVKSKGETVEIKVIDGIYNPSSIEVKKNKPFKIRFLRLDESPCSEFLIFKEKDISLQLSIGKPREIELTFNEIGEYEFTCQMGMYRGTIIVS